ncbi:MAG TPA: DNA polymerase, partial [Acidimicrobiales bacterium]|nr:DNA polymerase [Acidimicrobiales bacterium]
LDIETAIDGTLLDLGTITQAGDYQVWSSYDEWYACLVDEIAECPRADRVRLWSRWYAHFGAGFDWPHLIEWAIEAELLDDLKYIMSGSMPIGVNIKLKGIPFLLRLRDSFRILSNKLSTLCGTFGLTDEGIGKLNIDILPADLKKLNKAKYYEYLEQDCRALQIILLRFWELITNIFGDVGELPMTAPSLAMRIYGLYLPEGIRVPRQKTLKRLERRSYRGGMVRCLLPGHHRNVRVQDCNSMYPSQMRAHQYPTSYQGYWTTTYQAGVVGIWDVEYTQPEDERIGPLLVDEATGEPAWEGRTVAGSPELDYLLELGGTVTVIWGHVFVKTGPIFKTYIDRLWALRREAQTDGDRALDSIAKMLMNSLYGKFGQREEGWEIQDQDIPKMDAYLEQGVSIRIEGRFMLVLLVRKTETTFVGIASLVTSHARVALYRQGRMILEAGGYLILCDTDSWHYVDAEMPSGRELGEWKVEADGCDGWYLAKKLYWLEGGTLGDKIKMAAKGLPKARITRADFEHSLEGQTITKEYSTAPTVREVLIQEKKAAKWLPRTRTMTPRELRWDRQLEDENAKERKSLLRERRSLLYSMLPMGGIAPGALDVRSEWREAVPARFRRLKGLPADVVAAGLHDEAPWLGIETESELYDAFAEIGRKG